jgi:hypothetical protein
MINQVYGGSEFLNVQTYSNNFYIDSTALSAGQVRFNPSNRNMEVYDGNNWVTCTGSAQVTLSNSAEEILRWAQKKMQQEQDWQAMAQRNPAVRDAYEKFQQAEEQLRIVEALVRE